MPQLIVTKRTGEQCIVQGEPNLTLMEALRNAGIEDILALCGGVCSCATCHVHVDPAFARLLPTMSGDEDMLLDGSSARNECSRLACQIRLDESLSGLRVAIPDED
ncbi:MAG: 2Fe-2S iron-sulfur cluster binding domain-containing protein [Pseudomonadales bacterium]|nr:2Fe-2S iron-sulfur cluster binding domain-containing protein [Pseudomonadales bacterium]